MRKRVRISLILLLLVCCLSTLAAGDWKYRFWSLDQHPEILGGFLPSYIGMGAGWQGLHLIPRRTTEVQLLVAGGYYQQKMWQNPVTGLHLEPGNPPLIYDVMEFGWRLRFSQGFGESPVVGKDLWTVYALYDGFFTRTFDSMVTGKSRKNNGSDGPVLGINEWFSRLSGGPADSNAFYTDIGSGIGTEFRVGAKWDTMSDELVSQDGISTELYLLYAPLALNCRRANYYSIVSNSVFALTLYELPNARDGKMNTFSIVLVDRLNFTWTDGTKVPMRAQRGDSLGRKVRGYNTWSYNSQLTMVNNFDLRFCGPSLLWPKLVPRVNLFLDLGYGTGHYFHTTTGANDFLSSAGVQATVSLFDFIDLGLQYAYLFTGMNFAKRGDSLIMSVTFFLDF